MKYNLRHCVWVILFLMISSIGYGESFLKSAEMDGAKFIEKSSSIDNCKIQFSYKKDTFRRPYREWSVQYDGSNPVYKTITGNASILKIIKSGVWINPEGIDTGTPPFIDFDPEVDRARYYFYLRYPINESKDKIIELLSSELGFSYNNSEEYLTIYKATWNGQVFSLSSTTQSASVRILKNELFINQPINDILASCSIYYKVQIENATGNQTNYSGYFFFPPTFDEFRETMRDKMGISFKYSSRKTNIIHLRLK